jgi:hypothetical protein
MVILLVAAGVVWGAWLGRREAAHVGVGIGSYGLIGGALLGAAIGLGLSYMAWGIAVVTIIVLGCATVEIVRRW